MSELTLHQRLLVRLRDERCAGNSAELARRIKKAPTYVNRLFYPSGKKGAKGIGLEIITACNEAFNLPPGYWDGAEVNISVGAEVQATATVRPSTPKPPPIASKPNVIAVHPDDPLPDGFLYIKESTIAFSGGNGQVSPVIELVEESDPVTYSVKWFRKKRINPAYVRRYRVTDQSMEPLLFDGDTILVNHAETTVRDGFIYAFRYGDDLRVKKLFQRLDGTLTLRSINPAFADEVVPAALVQEHISIIGRVRDKSGSGGLG